MEVFRGSDGCMSSWPKTRKGHTSKWSQRFANWTFNTINNIVLSESIALTWVGGREACALEWLLEAIAGGWGGQVARTKDSWNMSFLHVWSWCPPRRVARHSAGYGRDPSVRKKACSQPCQAMCVFHNKHVTLLMPSSAPWTERLAPHKYWIVQCKLWGFFLERKHFL